MGFSFCVKENPLYIKMYEIMELFPILFMNAYNWVWNLVDAQ